MSSEGVDLVTVSKPTVGRPRNIAENDMYRLMGFFKKGCSVSLACAKSGIPRSVFYAEMQRNEEFRDKITAAQDTITNRAMRIIDGSLHRGDLSTAKWMLDRQDRRERNAQRAKEYRLIKRLTVTRTVQEKQSVEFEIDTLTE